MGIVLHTDILHVMPGFSAAVTLREALDSVGRSDEVASSFDDFSWGPIADQKRRATWFSDVFGLDYSSDSDRIGEFEELLCTTDKRVVFWLSRRSAFEYCNFLQALSHVPDVEADIMDVTDMSSGFINQKPSYIRTGFRKCSLIDHRTFVEYKLYDAAIPLSAALKADYLRTWQRLVVEDAPFRVWNGTDLVSTGADVFDDLIMSQVTTDWRKMARIIGGAMMEAGENDGILATSDLQLMAVIPGLVARGKIDFRGPLSEMRYCELRLMPAQSSGT